MQPNTARVIFSWNDNDPATQDGSDAMQHVIRGSASLNLLGGLPDPPTEPNDTRSFQFTVNNVCFMFETLSCDYTLAINVSLYSTKYNTFICLYLTGYFVSTA